MSLIQTADLTPSTVLSSEQRLQIYNGLDCCLTLEVFEELTRLHNQPPEIYSFERALQAPYLEIMNRGFRVDQGARAHAAKGLHQRANQLMMILNQLAEAVWDRKEKIKWLDNAKFSLNPKSPKQLAEFFYEKMRLPEVWLNFKGVKRLSTNREALEKLEIYQHARPFVSIILAIRDIGKQLEVMETGLDSDGRFRSSYNIAGTETGRPSSSENAFGHGGNAQNIPPGLRYVFVADQGYKLVVIDLEQVEARDVGFICGCLFNDWSFLNACESGDLHTNNAGRIWPEMNWSADSKHNRSLADQNFYREFSYRDMAKRGSHLSNYSGTAWTAARSLKVPLAMMEEFQARYCRGRWGHKTLPDIEPAFPCIPRWWQWCASELQTTHKMTNLFGRERLFFGRPEADETLREAIAHGPQSTTADRMNLGLWKVWRQLPEVQLLAQTYDSITFQVKEGPGFDETVGRALELIQSIKLQAPNGREYIVPGEAKIGWNWGYAGVDKITRKTTNPEGLIKWRPGSDSRQRATGLDRKGF